MDSFIEIKEEDIPKLYEMLKNDLPKSMHAYQFLKTATKWKSLKPDSDYIIKFLAPYGDFSETTFLIYSIFSFEGPICWSSAYSNGNEGLKRLVKALGKTRLIDWNGKFIFSCLEPQVAAAVLPLILILAPQAEYHTDSAYYLLASEASEMMPRNMDGYYMDNLNEVHAHQINEAWPHKFPGSVKFVRDMITINWGLGVFSRDTGELVSWGLLSNYGGLGLVQTVESEMRKGHGSNIVRALSRRLGRSREDVHLNVVEGNKDGNAFFKKLGFKPLFKSCWIFKF